MSLEEIIQQYINLPPAESSGFHKVLCPVCRDHGKKGLRAGWKFDVGTTGYSCFNCGVSARHEEGQKLSKNMRNILEAFGITSSELGEFNYQNLVTDFFHVKVEKKVSFEPKVLELPSHFYLLKDAEITDKWADFAWSYLEDRNQDPTEYPYYMSKHKDWKGRIIIPEFKNDKMIFYQGRDLTGKKTDKYLSPSCEKQNIIHGFELLWNDLNSPLYVVEGVFDALLIGGVSIFGNKMTVGQEHWLCSSYRQKVFIPDKWGYGKSGRQRIGDRCLELGWSLSLPDFGQDVKDISDAVKKYGRLYTCIEIASNIVSGDLAKMRLNLYYQ